MKNGKLKKAIFLDGRTLKELGKVANIPPSYISLATTGKFNLDQDQRRRLAQALGRPESEIFRNHARA